MPSPGSASMVNGAPVVDHRQGGGIGSGSKGRFPRSSRDELAPRAGETRLPLERVRRACPASVSVWRRFGRSLLVERAPQSLSEKSRGYRNTTEANEMIAPQIPAQSPSDRSNVAINDARVSGR